MRSPSRLAIPAGLLFAVGLVFLGDTGADAQPARDPAGAETLFRDGLALVDKGDWDAACPKFDKSMDLDPAVSTLVNVARCSRHFGKLATALAQLQDAQRRNREAAPGRRRDALDAFIATELGTLEPTVPRLTIRVSPAATGLTVTRDGTQISASALGEALPIDPGEHVVGATAAGFTAAERRVTIVAGQSQELVLALEPSSAPPTSSVTAPPASSGKPPPVATSAPPPPPASDTSGVVIAGWTTASVGAAAVVVGAVFGGLTLAESGSIPASCDADTLRCGSDADAATARDASSSGQTYSTVSTVLFPVGLGALAAGVVLIIVGQPDAGPEHATLVPVVAPGTGGLMLRGSF